MALDIPFISGGCYQAIQVLDHIKQGVVKELSPFVRRWDEYLRSVVSPEDLDMGYTVQFDENGVSVRTRSEMIRSVLRTGGTALEGLVKKGKELVQEIRSRDYEIPPIETLRSHFLS